MSKSARRRAREYALQGLYQRQLSGNAPRDIAKSLAEDPPFEKIDQAFFKTLFEGATQNAQELEQLLAGALDRKTEELSPIEKNILLLAAYELAHMPDIPYRVVINEAIELAKTFGGTDGHKYVNGVLDKIGPGLRPEEKSAGAKAG
jgi:transcription antitermination protein NusB